MTWRSLALVAVLAGIIGAVVVVDLSYEACRPFRADDVPEPSIVPPQSSTDRACARAILDDWYPDRVVDRAFPLRCYGFALAVLPWTGPDFSTVRADIVRAHTKRYLELHPDERLC